MKRFWKNFFTIGALAGGAYIGFKGYQRLSSVNKMSRTLPDYLEDLIDEKPKIKVNLGFNSLSIAVGLSSFALENIDFDLEDHITRYVIDYYPCLANLKITISQYIRAVADDSWDIDEEFYVDKDAEGNENYYDKDEESES